MPDLSAEFLSIAAEAGEVAAREVELDAEALSALDHAAEQAGRSWSQSSLGYQANVYYEGFRSPPAGHVFSREWGFRGQFHGTVGNWEIHKVEDVVAHVEGQAKNPDISDSVRTSDAVREPVEALIQRARSASARLNLPYDEYLKENVEQLQRIGLFSTLAIERSLLNIPLGNFPVRDDLAMDGGWQVAGHQRVLAKVMFIRSPYRTAKKLAEVCGRIGKHLQSVESGTEVTIMQLGMKVFIGHGGKSKEYLQLGVWLTDEGLDWDVYDRRPTAGLSTKERLAEMLDSAGIAFLIMTGEDETSDGKTRARENVVHEIGLFQGRIGFEKAIVLLEDGCEEFSNIAGIGQIRFAKDNIRTAFDEIRKVLQREGMIS